MFKIDKDLKAARQAANYEMFAPVPASSGRTDDDCAAVQWTRGRKSVVMNLNCYGGVSVNCCAAGGVVDAPSFGAAWKWFCSDSQELPLF